MQELGTHARLHPALATVCVLCLTNLALGWYFGYRAISQYLVFWGIGASVVLTAGRITRHTFPWAGRADFAIRASLTAYALVVLSGLALGAAGFLSASSYFLLVAALFLASCFMKPTERGAGVPDRLDAPVAVVVGVAAILAFIVGHGLTHSPLTSYDGLSYHLFFPARWLQEHRLSIIATPFSDEAQAYAPGNGELFFLSLMLPFHGDLLARIGQVPFYLLGGVTLYALARRMGARPEHAVYPAAFYFLSKPIVEEAVGANVDLICWATFLTSLYVGIAAAESNEPRDWALWGVSLGLYWGSKYVSLVYSPILLLPLVRARRLNVLWALPGVALLALPWYVRNWVIAGSPIYPASLGLLGFTIARGAYSHTAMLKSVFHTNDPRLFLPMAGHAFGPTLLLFWAPFALTGAWSIVGSRRWWPGGLFLLAPVLMVPLYWLGVPDNVDSRFLLPVAILAMLPLAFAFRANDTWNACVHAFYAAGLVWLVVGFNADLPVQLPWYMAGWLSLQGVVSRGALLPFAALSATAAGLWYVTRNTGHTASAMAALCCAASILVAIASETWCVPERCDALQNSSAYIRASLLYGWRWAGENVQHATFAYAGNNVPYPLTGNRLTNRVYYVNIDRHLEWRFHDYDRHRRRRREPPTTPSLATGSGVLLRLGPTGSQPIDAVRPRYERMQGDRTGWIHNLKAAGVDHLFVSALSAYEIDYVWHNAGAFPIEDEWARQDPQSFHLAYENPQVRIYALSLH